MPPAYMPPTLTERIALTGAEPVTLAEAKAQLRVIDDEESGYIEALLAVAREAAEDMTGRAFAPQEFRSIYPRAGEFGESPASLAVTRAPFVGLEELHYRRADGTLALYQGIVRVGRAGHGAIIDWTPPADFDATHPAPVELTFSAGYATVPAAVRQAILLLVAHLFETRTPVHAGAMTECPLTVAHLLNRYRMPNA